MMRRIYIFERSGESTIRTFTFTRPHILAVNQNQRQQSHSDSYRSAKIITCPKSTCSSITRPSDNDTENMNTLVFFSARNNFR
ncbi:hypothetical protein MPTK1_7g02380 [Marchantia polymorpha subsp. ruderalis]|uniref:Uncharacterized protein n=2 Tax=Marchantia polymorpha TaxID=3197 RepID=A0AAF6BVD4_MARPO|nr:hypothetical protein MARPO_0088s0048 [Marchantia polymorpha]BBN15968.1 hypothetical protein Mp_7g02380 [Marchantia polymorpha subsp. ruderalis]|eukprot:PTQ33502.1 hypothetical protein MARPO_0088s0048 [Marchantia polymorpha]